MPRYLIKVCPYYDGRILHPVGSEVEIPAKRNPPQGALPLDDEGVAIVAKMQASKADRLKEQAKKLLEQAASLESPPKAAAPAAAPAPENHGKRPSDRKVI